MNPSFIEVVQLKKSFASTEVLRGVNFRLEEGESCAIRGASGSGKSTLLYLIGGLEPLSKGQGDIFIAGKNIRLLSEEQLANYRNRQVGFVFQFHYLLPSMNCLENILLPCRIHGGVKENEVLKNVLELSKHLDVEHCLEKYPYQLSGGEQQRVNVIRALSLKPKLILCDEPTGNLDSKNSQKVATLIYDLAQEFSSTLIVVTHDKSVASHFKREVIMEDGLLRSPS